MILTCETHMLHMESGWRRLFLGHHSKTTRAEHMNKTLNERARSMRLHAGLPKTSWADVIIHVAYLINCGPSIPMEFRLPEEIWSGKEVKFSHLKVFCCVSYVHIDSVAHSKLDAKSKICFFIDYGDEKFGYHSWDE